MKPARIILIFAALAAVFLGGWFAGSMTPHFWQESSEIDDAPIATPIVRVVAQGRLLPKHGLISVYSPPNQRVEKILVKVGDPLVANETELATYLGQETLLLQSELAESRSEDASRELDQKILQAESTVLSARNAVELAKLQREQASASTDFGVLERQLQAAREKLERLSRLADDPQTALFVSRSQLQAEQLRIDQSASELEAARTAHANAMRAAELNVGTAEKSLAQAQTALDSLTRLRDENRTLQLTQKIAESQTQNSRLIAPTDGEVLKIFGKPGEVLVNSPLLQIGDVTQMVCVAEVVDRLVPEVAVGQRVSITAGALSRPLSGTVVEIGQVVGNSTLMDPNPLALVDRKTVDVRIEIDASDVKAAARIVNLQVSVEIETKPAEKLPGTAED
jgi:HlyD family secretion protein